MPSFEPFAGVRYDTDRHDLAAVTAPPYDVIDAAEREALAREPCNVVHIDLPVADGSGADPYEQAGATLSRWRAADDLVTDSGTTFTGYRMTWSDGGITRSTVGVIGALRIEPLGSGDVLPHERTTPKAKSDRLQLLRATEANLSAVWGLSLAEGLTKLIEPPDAGVESWTDDDGVTHSAWVIDDHGAVAAIAEAVGGAPVVIADGHHRYETCGAFAAERPDLPGAQATMAFVVELAPDQLAVQAIHRLLSGLPDGYDVRPALASSFEVTDEPAAGAMTAPGLHARMRAENSLALVDARGAALLRPRPGAFDGVPDRDSSRVDAALEALPPHELAYQHGVDRVIEAVRSGTAQAGIVLRPVSVDHIAAVAHARDRMPPKTTFFTPKPKTGVVFRVFS